MSPRHGELFTTIRTEGGLLPPALLERIGRNDPNLPGLRPEDYHLASGERLGEAINRSWLRLVAAWGGFREALAATPPGDPAVGLTRERWLLILFSELGYGRLQPSRAVEIEGREYPVSHHWGNTPIHLVGAGVELGKRTPGVAGASRLSPHALVQELLNRSPERLWAFLSNGLTLRILRDNAALTRQAFVEFDLEAMMDGEIYSDFAVLWLVCHESRVEPEDPYAYLLERWSEEGRTQGTRALDHLREGVEHAIQSLGTGFLRHQANRPLAAALTNGTLSPIDYYRQLLRVVYRLIFLFVAEERRLLHPTGTDPDVATRYGSFYSVARIRELAERRRGGPHADLWQQFHVVVRALGSQEGLPALGLPALGGLFSPIATAELDVSSIANADLLEAIRGLSGRTDERHGYRWRFDYRNLGVEELGSVYESLLELHPEVNVQAGEFTLTTGGRERRSTGSHYTPPSILGPVLDFALDPVLAAAASSPEPENALLSLRILDPACGSGHFLIAASHRVARALAAARTGEPEPPPEAVGPALRDVVARCVYGVDLNPMAVELCKVALWLETLEPGKPLGFLDHHIRHGNSLLGVPLGTTVARNRAAIEVTRKALEQQIGELDVTIKTAPTGDRPALVSGLRDLRKTLRETLYDSWTDAIPDEAFKATSDDDRAFARKVVAANKQQRRGGMQVLAPVLVDLPDDLVAVFDRLGEGAEDSITEVTIRAEAFDGAQRRAEYRHLLEEANVWTAAWFWSLRPDEPPAPTQAVFLTLTGNLGSLPDTVADRVASLAEEHSFFHFELAYPEVFTTERGGFDVVIGNPPYLGGPMISGTFGERTLKFLKENHLARTGGRVDLVAYFLRRSFDLACAKGAVGLITTNSIAEGDTLRAGLAPITEDWGGAIADALRSVPWEGEANVSVTIVHLVKGNWDRKRTLDGREVDRISGSLSIGDIPHASPLAANHGKMFKGSNPLGRGFQLDEAQAKRLLRESSNRDVVRPLYGADDVTSIPDLTNPHRWIIDFQGRSLEESDRFAEPMEIVRRLVEPERQALNENGEFKVKRKAYRDRWWQFAERSANLYDKVGSLDRVIAIPEVSKTMLPVFVPGGAVYLQTLFVLASNDTALFAVLSSSFHWLWAALPSHATSLESRPRYHSERCFEAFPLPEMTGELALAGSALNDFRSGAMLDRQIGLTKLYNLVNDPEDQAGDVRECREVIVDVDVAVAAAYGWTDIDFRHGVHEHTRFESRWLPCPDAQREIEARLLQLNLERSGSNLRNDRSVFAITSG